MLSQSVRSRDEKVVIAWKNICFETLVKDKEKSKLCNSVYKRKTVLNNLSGRAESSQLLAILGPTGCGLVASNYYILNLSLLFLTEKHH